MNAEMSIAAEAMIQERVVINDPKALQVVVLDPWCTMTTVLER